LTAAKKLLALTLPAVLFTLLIVEVAVRYSGWFAGVPVHINNLGLRDTRDYQLAKGPTTFRILVLGDSVTFGHGSVYEHTYPYLLEQRLEAWRPEIDWQVWNAGVPGYNSAQELGYLRRVGAAFQPDLVIVGFYPNDIIANGIVAEPTRADRAVASAKNWMKQRFYSYDLYRRVYLELSWRASRSKPAKTMLENLGTEAAMLADVGTVQNEPQQQLTDIRPVSADTRMGVHCRGEGLAADEVRAFESDPSAEQWRAAIQAFQEFHRRGEYHVVFFINTAPEICAADDLFFDGGSRAWNEFFVTELARDVPAVSTYDAFMNYRPSQVPEAKGHALGNANRVKADVLFDFLVSAVLPAVPTRSAE
jgi:GDSL-like lipase/acylhydrolase family protein